MYALRLVPQYIWWHYTDAFLDMFHIAGNVFWFLWHFFSVPDILRTFFEPWQRLRETYRKGFDLEAMASSFVVNVIMRLVGMFMRSTLLFFALVSFIAAFAVVAAVFFIWIIIPLGLVALLVFGIGALLK